MEDLNDLYYYVQVVDYGGFAAAGRALSIPKSRLSRRIANLESRLGVRLIQRSTRQFHVTDIGRTYYDHCKAMLVEAEAARLSVEVVHAEPCGIIRLSCPITLLHVHVSRMLCDFMVKYPQLSVHLEATNRRVDVLAEGFDLAIRVRPFPIEDSDLVLRVLSDRGQALVASPRLAQQHGIPETPRDLEGRPSMVHGRPEETFEWILNGPDGVQVIQPFVPRLVSSDMAALHRAALAGVGVVQLPLLMVQDDFTAGRLLHLLPGWKPRREVIHAIFPSRRGLLPAVRLLIDYLAESYAEFEEN